MENGKKIKVLIVDGSAVNRNIIRDELSKDPEIQVQTEPDIDSATFAIIESPPDVITLDIETTQMEGIEFIRGMMPQKPIPVIVVSYLTLKGKHITLQALEAGAVDYVPKPTSDIMRGLNDFIGDLTAKIKIGSQANVSHWINKKFEYLKRFPEFDKDKADLLSDKIVVIGGSIGGIEGLRKMITRFPKNMPCVLVVQHIFPGFSKTLAYRLDEISGMNVKEAESGDIVQPGFVFIAPGDFHMKIVNIGGKLEITCESGEKVNGQRPSIDVLMFSIAEYIGNNAVGVLLAGNGNDGALGLKAMKNSGAKTITQDEPSSIFYDAPLAALEYGAVDTQMHLDDMALGLMKILTGEAEAQQSLDFNK
jgi:two-component system chemotaxis response regulator CheB